MVPPSPGPLPPPDFASRDLPIEEIASGARLMRIHRSELGPLFFGSTGGNRFDDPTKIYGVCYLATTLEGAFAETCLRSAGTRFVAMTFLEARSFSEVEVTAPLRLVSLHGPGLAQIGATGAVTWASCRRATVVASHPRPSYGARRHCLPLQPRQWPDLRLAL